MHISLCDPYGILFGHPLIHPIALEWFLFTSECHIQTLHARVKWASALAHSFAQDLVSNHKLVPKGA